MVTLNATSSLRFIIIRLSKDLLCFLQVLSLLFFQRRINLHHLIALILGFFKWFVRIWLCRHRLRELTIRCLQVDICSCLVLTVSFITEIFPKLDLSNRFCHLSTTLDEIFVVFLVCLLRERSIVFSFFTDLFEPLFLKGCLSFFPFLFFYLKLCFLLLFLELLLEVISLDL